MASGGYRKPAHPAPVSGPGALSRRTDTGPAQKLRVGDGMPYGERQALLNEQRTEPLAQVPQTSAPPVNVTGGAPAQAGPPAGPQYSGAPFNSPTQRPQEPITHGVDIGPGGGSGVLPPAAQPQYQQQGPMTQMLANLQATDRTGVLGQLYQSALKLGA